MELTPYMPIIVEATKFLFDEVGKWLDNVRQRSKKAPSEPVEDVVSDKAPKLTRQDFALLEANPPDLETAIDVRLAKTDAYVIQGLIGQIQTHRRNLVDLESTEAEFGSLTPQHIKRGIEREADAIVEKSARLKSLLEQIYGKGIESA